MFFFLPNIILILCFKTTCYTLYLLFFCLSIALSPIFLGWSRGARYQRGTRRSWPACMYVAHYTHKRIFYMIILYCVHINNNMYPCFNIYVWFLITNAIFVRRKNTSSCFCSVLGYGWHSWW